MTQWKKYLLWFAQEHIDFRYSEIQSILKLFEIPFRSLDTGHKQRPFYTIELNDDLAAKKLASRSVSLRCILELWTHTQTIPMFHTTLKKYLKENEHKLVDNFTIDKTFKITVETYNRHYKQCEKIDKIETIDYLPVLGEVNLKTPTIEWWYIEYYGLDTINCPKYPLDVMFGKWISDGKRSLLKEISLKTRAFIGNTSMDPQLSLLMANQALVKRSDIVYDPFVGSGSLLVAAAVFGAYVMGCDIDFLMLHGRTRPTRVRQKVRAKNESILTNLKQYNCQHLYLDVLVSDFSTPIWNDNIIFDSIITDPPYGIREATEKVEQKVHVNSIDKLMVEPQSDQSSSSSDQVHFPSTSHYNPSQLYSDLLNFSARYLKLGGRLVCWIPIIKHDYNEDMIPKHNCLKLIANSEQDLTALTARRLLTYEKIQDFNIEHELTTSTISYNVMVADFREKFFTYGEDTREERRLRRAESKEIGRQEAIKRGKTIDNQNKVCSIPKTTEIIKNTENGDSK